MKRWITVLFLCCVIVITLCFSKILSEQNRQSLYIITHKGKATYQIEVADTPARQQRGLMYRKSIPTNQGMLFDFHQEKIVFMWMKNTYIPLDMLFADKKGIIRHIHEGVRPLDETIIPSQIPIRYVIELNAGQVKEKGIQIGNKIRGLK